MTDEAKLAVLENELKTLKADLDDAVSKLREREIALARTDGVKKTLIIVMPIVSVIACIWIGIEAWNDLPKEIERQVKDKVAETATAQIQSEAIAAKEATLQAQKKAAEALKNIDESRVKQAKEFKLVTRDEFDKELANCLKVDQEVAIRTKNTYIPDSFLVLQTEPDHGNKSFFLFDPNLRDDHKKRAYFLTPYDRVPFTER